MESEENMMRSEMLFEIFLEDERWGKSLPVYESLVDDAIKALESYLGDRLDSDFECTLILANNAFLQDLNNRFRGKNKPTNVLSFPFSDSFQSGESKNLGDIFFALETLEDESKLDNKKIEHHFQHLVIHGILHLLGYDHEIEEDAKIMEDLEIQILAILGISNPYLDSVQS